MTAIYPPPNMPDRRDTAISCLCAIALAVLLCATAALFGAPVPPAPRDLDRAAFVGVWRYGYGSQPDGVIHFAEDASYYSVHRIDSDVAYCGSWHATGRTLVLRERALNLDTGSASAGVTEYRIEFDKWPARTGRTQHGVSVTLSRVSE